MIMPQEGEELLPVLDKLRSDNASLILFRQRIA
jgi:hypothetical protein